MTKWFYSHSIPQALQPLFKKLHNGEICISSLFTNFHHWNCAFLISLLWVFHTFHLWPCEESVPAFSRSFFLWIFQCKWKFRSCEALFIEVPLTQAQVSPGVTHNSLRGMSTQANLMGIPFPHTLGWPAYAGTTAANTPFTKVYSTTFVWWCDASQQDFILCASLT